MQRNLKRFARFPSFRGWDTHPEETHPTSGHQQVGASPNRSRPYLLKMAYVATARKARRGCPRCVPAQREGPKLVLFCEMQQSNQKELLSVSKLTWSLENYVKVPPSGRRRRPPRRSVFAFVCDFFGGGVARAVAVGGCVRAAGRVAVARMVARPARSSLLGGVVTPGSSYGRLMGVRTVLCTCTCCSRARFWGAGWAVARSVARGGFGRLASGCELYMYMCMLRVRLGGAVGVWS